MAHRIKQEMERLSQRLAQISTPSFSQGPMHSRGAVSPAPFAGRRSQGSSPPRRKPPPSSSPDNKSIEVAPEMSSRTQQVLAQRDQAKSLLQGIARAIEEEEDKNHESDVLPAVPSARPGGAGKSKPAKLCHLESAMKGVLEQRKRRASVEAAQAALQPQDECCLELELEPASDSCLLEPEAEPMPEMVESGEELDEHDAKENDVASQIGSLIARRHGRDSLGTKSFQVKRDSRQNTTVLKKQVIREVSAILTNRSPSKK